MSNDVNIANKENIRDVWKLINALVNSMRSKIVTVLEITVGNVEWMGDEVTLLTQIKLSDPQGTWHLQRRTYIGRVMPDKTGSIDIEQERVAMRAEAERKKQGM